MIWCVSGTSASPGHPLSWMCEASLESPARTARSTEPRLFAFRQPVMQAAGRLFCWMGHYLRKYRVSAGSFTGELGRFAVSGPGSIDFSFTENL
jgi:hypothetical protein